MAESAHPALLPPLPTMRRALERHDAAFDGVFFTAVRTTGIFCRPSCPSRPKVENVEFFGQVRECIAAGYRACKRCRPLEVNGAPPDWIQPLIDRVEKDPSIPVRAAELRDLGVTPERARRWFLAHHGMSFAAWCRGRRLARAFTELKEGDAVEDAMLANGFTSHSGFESAFKRAFGEGPRPSGEVAPVFVKIIQSPLGPMVAAAGPQGLAFLEFADRKMLESNFAALRRQMKAPVVPGTHAVLEQTERELAEYFAGRRRTFRMPLDPRGTGFQLRVWEQLRGIPHAETIPYDELAKRIGQPTAMRAVAQANGCNKIAIVIPCHRVIGKDGSLTGYGGGLWRKRLLLELERTGSMPGGEQ